MLAYGQLVKLEEEATFDINKSFGNLVTHFKTQYETFLRQPDPRTAWRGLTYDPNKHQVYFKAKPGTIGVLSRFYVDVSRTWVRINLIDPVTVKVAHTVSISKSNVEFTDKLTQEEQAPYLECRAKFLISELSRRGHDNLEIAGNIGTLNEMTSKEFPNE
jgi:hypothetical protein